MNIEESGSFVEVGDNPNYRTWMCIDRSDQYYAWIFTIHADDRPIALRKATDYEVFTVMRSLPGITTREQASTSCEPSTNDRVFATPDAVAFWTSETAKRGMFMPPSEKYEVCTGIRGAWQVIPATHQ